MNYYRAVEKKPEHGGGWAFMQLNRRSGAAIVCQCGEHPDPWTQTGHATAEEAERCFYVAQVEKGVRWSVYTHASECEMCGEWTPDSLHSDSNLLTVDESVCKKHFTDDASAASWLWRRHPFAPGIEITASW